MALGLLGCTAQTAGDGSPADAGLDVLPADSDRLGLLEAGTSDAPLPPDADVGSPGRLLDCPDPEHCPGATLQHVECNDGTGASDCCIPLASSDSACTGLGYCWTKCTMYGRSRLFCDGSRWNGGKGLFPCPQGEGGAE